MDDRRDSELVSGDPRQRGGNALCGPANLRWLRPPIERVRGREAYAPVASVHLPVEFSWRTAAMRQRAVAALAIDHRIAIDKSACDTASFRMRKSPITRSATRDESISDRRHIFFVRAATIDWQLDSDN